MVDDNDNINQQKQKKDQQYNQWLNSIGDTKDEYDDIHLLNSMFRFNTAMSTTKILNNMKDQHRVLFDQFSLFMKTEGGKHIYTELQLNKRYWQFEMINDLICKAFNYNTMKEKLCILVSVCQYWKRCVFKPGSWKYIKIKNNNYTLYPIMDKLISVNNVISLTYDQYYVNTKTVNSAFDFYNKLQSLVLDFSGVLYSTLFDGKVWRNLNHLTIKRPLKEDETNENGFIISFPELVFLEFGYSFGSYSKYEINKKINIFDSHTPKLKTLIVKDIPKNIDNYIFFAKVENLSFNESTNNSNVLVDLFKHDDLCNIKHLTCGDYKYIANLNNYYNENTYRLKHKCIYLESLTVNMKSEKTEYCSYLNNNNNNNNNNKVLYNHINITMLSEHYRLTVFPVILIFENQLNQLYKLNLHYLKIQFCTIEYMYTIMKSHLVIDILELDVVFNLSDISNMNKKSVNCKIHTLKLDSDKVTLELDHLLHIRKHICENVFYTKRMSNRNLSLLSPNAIVIYEYIRDNPMCGESAIYNSFRDQLLTTIISALDILTVNKFIFYIESGKYYNVTTTNPYKKEEVDSDIAIEDEITQPNKKSRKFYDSDEEDL